MNPDQKTYQKTTDQKFPYKILKYLMEVYNTLVNLISLRLTKAVMDHMQTSEKIMMKNKLMIKKTNKVKKELDALI